MQLLTERTRQSKQNQNLYNTSTSNQLQSGLKEITIDLEQPRFFYEKDLGNSLHTTKLPKEVTTNTIVASDTLKSEKTSLRIRLADCKKDILAAQRLRSATFSAEFGFQCGNNGIDADIFDAYCHHLLVEDMTSNTIVGTYRLLNSYGALRCGKHYGQNEFSGALWHDMGDNLVEIGRACIHPDFRSGAALMKLWQGIMDYLGVLSVRYAIGYASVSLRDGGANALTTQAYVRAQCKPWTGAALKPIKPLSLFLSKAEANFNGTGEVSSLIKGYVRMGSFCIGEPAYDPIFNTADFPMLLDMTQLDKRYAKHFKVDQNLSNLN